MLPAFIDFRTQVITSCGAFNSDWIASAERLPGQVFSLAEIRETDQMIAEQKRSKRRHEKQVQEIAGQTISR
jgi:hypothetical protein